MPKKEKKGILFFVKYPEMKRVKTRLSEIIDYDIVVEIYRLFVEDILNTLKWKKNNMIICFYPKSKLSKFERWLGTDYIYIPQIGNSFGERLKNGFSFCFKNGFSKLVAIGSDSPDITVAHIDESFKKLGTNDAVIGPCLDGGYYLIGFTNKSFYPRVFTDIQLSTSTVYEKTFNMLKKAGLRVHSLSYWQDVDNEEDLIDLYEKNLTTKFRSSKTMSYLSCFFRGNPG